MYSIYIPHETEYIYLTGFKDFEKEISIHKTLWPSINSVDSDMLRFGEQIKENIFEMRKYKSDKNLSMKADMDKFVIHGDKNYEEWFKATEKDFIACSHAIKIEYELI